MPWSDYQKVREIGSGSFGRAYLVNCNRPAGADKKLLVLKEIDMHKMDSRERKAAQVEVQVLASLKHPYIVRYSESFVHDHVLCIVMDYCEGGDLWQYINQRKKQRSNIAETQVIRWFTQMCLALKHMHDKNVLHRDIKTQNIFLAKRQSSSDSSSLGCVKIADFGIAKVLDSHTALARTQVGTPYYLSPEICQKQPYAQPSDVWALGCVLYELCALKVPFEAQDLPQLVDRIVRSPVPKIPTTYCKELGEIVGELLSRRACERPTAEKVLQKATLQAEIKKMIGENKKHPAKDGENQVEEQRGRRDPSRDNPNSARDQPVSARGGANGQQPQQPQHGRGVLQERNHSNDPRDRRGDHKSRAASREPSPHREAAKQIIGPSRAPSPRQRENQPHSARQEYIPISARHAYNRPHSANARR